MKRILLLWIICLFFGSLALADTSSAVLVPVKHRVHRHHAHKAVKHHPRHRARHGV